MEATLLKEEEEAAVVVTAADRSATETSSINYTRGDQAVTTPAVQDYREKAIAMIRNGYSVTPIRPGEKRPLLAAWQKTTITEDEVQKFANCGWGVLTGVGDVPVVAIDIDFRHEEVAQAIEDWCHQNLGFAPVRVGSPPKRLLVYRASEAGWHKTTSAWFVDPELLKSLAPEQLKSKLQRVEILGQGQQFVAYGRHPSGREYEWLDIFGGLTGIPVATLEVVTEDQIAELLQAVERIAASFGLVKLGGDSQTKEPTGTGREDPALPAEGQPIFEGTRNETLFRLACSMQSRGFTREAIRAALEAENRRCVPPFKPHELDEIVKSASRYPSGDHPPRLPDGAPVWGDPQPLPDSLPPVAPFDPELLPEALRPWVADVAERMQCPVDFCAVGAVVALSGLIGARAVIKPKERDDWTVVPNLWGMIVGRPGVMKTPALSEMLKPLHRLEGTERERWQVAHADWERQAKVAELAAKGREKQAAKVAASDPAKAARLLEPADELPPEPIARRYVVNDASVEALHEVLLKNPWGVLVFRDELHSLLCSMDREGQEAARGFYLTAWNGDQGYVVDRILRGLNQYTPRVCLSLLGSIQPGRLQSYVREAVTGGSGDDGLLQRFGLAVWPDVVQEFRYVDRWPDSAAKESAWAVFERLNELQPDGDNEPQVWRFSNEAQALFAEWLVEFETEIRGEELHPALVAHLAKYRKLVPALALIFALIDTPDSDFRLVQERELRRAIAWARYLRTHAERVYSAAVTPETAGAKTLLDKIRSGKLSNPDGTLAEYFTPRVVALKHWAGLTTPEAVRRAADLLADYGWLARDVVLPGPSGGRPSERYLIHPKLLAGGDHVQSAEE
jgi:hypothetical protein